LTKGNESLWIRGTWRIYFRTAPSEFWTLGTLKRLDYSANGHGTQGSHLFGAFLVPRGALEQLAFEYKGAGQFPAIRLW
jgi:hypothetical protein